MVRTIFAQPDAATVREQYAGIVAQLEQRFHEVAALLDDAGTDLLAFDSFPKEQRRLPPSSSEDRGVTEFARITRAISRRR